MITALKVITVLVFSPFLAVGFAAALVYGFVVTGWVMAGEAIGWLNQ